MSRAVTDNQLNNLVRSRDVGPVILLKKIKSNLCSEPETTLTNAIANSAPLHQCWF